MARINTYPAATSLADDDVLIIDGATNGTRTITGATLKALIAGSSDPFTGATATNVLDGANTKFLIKKGNGKLYTLTYPVLVSILKQTMGLNLTAITNAQIDQYFEDIVNGTTN